MTNPTSPMLENMARALFDADCELCADFTILPETWATTKRRPAYMILAKAALQSLKDLDEGTVEALWTASLADWDIGDAPAREHLARGFTAAIEYILKDGEP